ncbi:MAG: hypothetical protein EBT15_11645 [Betaproteobacteria bacterium]|nr:hypothetical protein [Betaproteobacteria bacterium]
MADYAIGLAFHKANRTLVRAVELVAPNRYFATRDSAGNVTLPTLASGYGYIEVQGLTQASFQVNDTNKDFRLLGDDGWSDSVITGSSIQASCSGYFLRQTEVPAGSTTPSFYGNYDEGFNLIQRARYDKNFEIYVEFLKELGQASGSTGNFIYDFTGFNAVMQNYKEQESAEGLTEVSFDLMSRGRPVFGKYDAGSTALTFGSVQSSLLFLVNGTRQAAVVPADNASAVATSSTVTVTYTSNGTAALSNLALGQTDGSGFRLEVASTGALVPASVALGGAGTNVVTLTPSSALSAGTIYRLKVADGAITQAVSGVKRPIQGLAIEFRTA